MNLEFDQDKRDKTLQERGLDFARAAEVFEGIHFTGQDTPLAAANSATTALGAAMMPRMLAPVSALPAALRA